MMKKLQRMAEQTQYAPPSFRNNNNLGVFVISKHTAGPRGGIFHSMYARLLLTMIFLTVVPVILLQVFYTSYIIRMIRDNRVDLVREYSSQVSSEIVRSGYIDGKENSSVDRSLRQFCDTYDGRAIVLDPSCRVRSDTYGLITGSTLVTSDAVLASQGTEADSYDRSSDRVRLTCVVKDPSGNIVGSILFILSCRDLTSTYGRIVRSLIYIMIVVSLALLWLSFVMSRRFTRPFASMYESVDRIAEGHFDKPVNLRGFTEIEQLSDAFNRMLSRLKELEDSRQEFVSNVSHELKTPLTSMKVLADSLNSQPDVPVEIYQDFMQDITREIDRENTIINDLLSLVKMDKTEAEPNISRTDLNKMLEDIRKRLRPLAARRSVEIELQADHPVEADCDEIKLSLALSNLVENAIKYNTAGGWVRMSLDSDDTYFYISVADSGIGIPAEDQEKIFERFYRVDKARSRESGGTGLGLAITKSIVMMHHGMIKVSSKEDQGTIFSVRIPLVYKKEAEHS